MATRIRLAARALQSRGRLAFLLLFFGELLLLAAALSGALLLWRLPLAPALRFGGAGSLALLAFWLPALFWQGDAAFFRETAQTGSARLGRFFSVLRPKAALRALAAFWLCALLRFGFFLLSFLPAAILTAYAFFLLRHGTCALCAAFLILGCAAAAILGLVCFLRLSDLLLLAPYLSSDGLPAGACLRQSLRRMETAAFMPSALRRGFLGWFFACVLLLPLPFVWGCYCQSRALLACCLLRGCKNQTYS